LLCMKSCILEWYCCVGSMTIELPLSALAIMALFLLSLELMECISLASGCVLSVGLELF
jgi:diacylglycerol kinase